MQKFVLDTGVILGYIRAAGYADYIERNMRRLLRQIFL